MFVLSLSYFENIMSLLNQQQKKKQLYFVNTCLGYLIVKIFTSV